MSKVHILRFERTGGPGYFGRYLDDHQIPQKIHRIDQGESVPESIDGVGGLCFLGGVMSVNDDDLPWIPQVLDLIRRAHDRDIPMLGHCLGGQLIARALGGTVSRSPVEEIGWLPVELVNDAKTPAWCEGLPRNITVFEWHNETFSVPAKGQKLFHRDTCPNQGFQYGNALALQFHLEVLPETVKQWTSLYLDESHRLCETVQSREFMIEKLQQKAELSHKAADHIYSHWCSNLQ
jgi:GMP synthase-like glutamine amidotransferase